MCRDPDVGNRVHWSHLPTPPSTQSSISSPSVSTGLDFLEESLDTLPGRCNGHWRVCVHPEVSQVWPLPLQSGGPGQPDVPAGQSDTPNGYTMTDGSPSLRKTTYVPKVDVPVQNGSPTTRTSLPDGRRVVRMDGGDRPPWWGKRICVLMLLLCQGLGNRC